MQRLELLCYFVSMFLSYFFLVPAAFVYYMAGCRDSDVSANILAFLSGIAAGLASLLIGNLFYPLFPADTSFFWVKFAAVFLFETVLPVFGGLTALYFILVAPVKLRISNMRPQLFGICTFYLPYLFFTRWNNPDIWSVVFAPVMLVSILFLADFFIGRVVASVSTRVDPLDFFLSVLPVIAALVFADLCKTLWFFAKPLYVYLPLSIAIILFSFVLRLLKYRKQG